MTVSIRLAALAAATISVSAATVTRAPDPGDAAAQRAALEQAIETDWMHQTDRKSLPERTIQEIKWAREIAGRMSKLTGAPDLRAELAQLAKLEEAATLAVSAPPAPVTQPVVKLPNGLVGRWVNYQLDESSFLNVGAQPAAVTASNYTLCAWIRTTKNAGDVMGNGTSGGCFLLMVNGGVVRAHQWPAKGLAVP